jgi:lysophospholipase L1-like esterase
MPVDTHRGSDPIAVDADTADIPAPPRGRERTARDALICIGVCALVLLAFEGASVRRAGQDLDHGWQRTLVLAVGTPAGWLSDASGLGAVKDRALAWERSGGGQGGAGAFDDRAPAVAVAAVTPEAIDPRAIGARPTAPPALDTVLVTGDSMSQPLDAALARAFARAGSGVEVVRDAHLGTGISQSDILDWGAEAVQQVRERHPQAVVMFLGANEGFPLRQAGREVACCGVGWTTAYATRVRQMMNTYRQAGAARVYWLNLPGPRDAERQRVTRAVNAAIAVAAEAYRAQVRVVDLATQFTPGGRYREAMAVDGREQIVREHDGVHLDGTGARVALAPVLVALKADFGAAKVPGP